MKMRPLYKVTIARCVDGKSFDVEIGKLLGFRLAITPGRWLKNRAPTGGWHAKPSVKCGSRCAAGKTVARIFDNEVQRSYRGGQVNTKREGLEYLQQHSNWLNGRVPTIMTAAAQAPDRRFYTVAWWGDDDKQLPAGFTHFEFEQVMGNAYVIFWRDEPRDRVGTLEADELVLMFSD